jgi:multidrug resistance efflux pump
MTATAAPPAAATSVPARPRRLPRLVWAGLLLLAVSVGVPAAGWGLQSSPGASPTGSSAPQAAPAPRGELRAVSIAHVDADPGLVPLYPLQPGRVAEVLVKEGDEVEEGAPLLRLDDAVARTQVDEAKAALAAAAERLKQAGTLQAQHQKRVEAAQAALDAAEQDAAAARAQRDKAKGFFDRGVSGSKEDVAAAEALVRKAEDGVKARRAELDGLKLTDPSAGVRLAQDDVDAKKAQLRRAEKGLEYCTVTAPAKGSVLRLNVGVGEVLGASPNPQRLPLLFCPSGPRIVRAEVEQEFAGGVAKGQVADIVDEATGAGHWTGKVEHVSDWFTHRRSVLLEPMQFNDVRTLECIIRLDPNQPPLRIGQRVLVKLRGS